MKIPKMFVPEGEGLAEKLKEYLEKETKDLEGVPDSSGKVQYFLDLWREQAAKSSSRQKDNIAMAYLKEVLGVSIKTCEDFKYDRSDAYKMVGMLQSGARERKESFDFFWQTVRTIFPSEYSNKDVEFLMSGGIHSVFTFMYAFENSAGTTDLLNKLRVNAHIYK